MSKSKEQCMVIISERLSGIDKHEKNIYLNSLKESIKDITGSEYGLLWLYDVKTRLLKVEDKEFKMQTSILSIVRDSKKGLYENYVKSHKLYNNKIDNPLNINIKSVLIVPILNKETKTVIGFISAINSMDNLSDFQRYDLRSLSLLEIEAQNLIKCIMEKKVIPKEEVKKEKKSNNSIVEAIQAKTKKIANNKKILKKEKKVTKIEVPKKETLKKEVPKKNAPKRKTKLDLELELKEQAEKIKKLEGLLVKEEKKATEVQYEIVPVEVLSNEEVSSELPIDNYLKLKTILDYLTKEVTYLDKESNSIYLFLEIIRNSLHNEAKLAYVEEKFINSGFLNDLVDNFYTKEQMNVTIETFKLYSSIISVASLYSHYFTQKNILFNIFIDPMIPSTLESDVTLIQSLLTHLLNNANCLVKEHGVIELFVLFSEESKSLEIEIKVIQAGDVKPFRNFFKNKAPSNSMTSDDAGLGLSVSSNILNILGGKLKLATTGINENSFITVIPVELTEIVSKKDFRHKRPTKIGILTNDENAYAYNNLRRYLEGFGIDESNIITLNSPKKIRNMKISHFICFENMLTDKIDLSTFSDITVLKYVDKPLSISINNKKVVANEVYLNSYYGMQLQKILFPDLAVEEMEENTLLIEDSFLSKIRKRFK
jgi:hypothetical protein